MKDNYTPELNEIILQYLDGLLPEKEREALEARFRTEPALAEELENARLGIAAVRQYGIYNQVGSLHSEMMTELQQGGKMVSMKKRSPFRIAFRAAAAVLILLAGFTIYQYATLSPARLFDEQYSRFQPGTLRSGDNSSVIETAYRNGNMQEVIRFENDANLSVRDHFFIGQAALQLKDAGKAILHFTSAAQMNKVNQSFTYQPDIEYYLALSYLSNGQTSQARDLLQAIRSNPQHPYNKAISNWFWMKLKWMND